MSANLELVRSIYAAWGRGDFSTTEWAHPEIEWIIADGPTAGRWTGVAEMVESFGRMPGAWDTFRAEAEEDRELDRDRVLVLLRRAGPGKPRGLELGQVETAGATRTRASA